MKKVMVLGAGRGQVPVINLCLKYGWQTIVATPKGNYPGEKLADKIVDVNVRDYEAVYEVAKKENIDAILTDQLDGAVFSAAYTAEKLGLKGIGIQTAKYFTDKYAMRKMAAKAGVHVPKSFIAYSVDEAIKSIQSDVSFSFPLMVKPVDSAASRGVYQINSFEDLKTYFPDSKSYSKEGSVIIEQFINGKEYVIEAFTKNYKTTNLVVGHREYFDVPGTFIPNATIFRDAVSADTELEKRIKEANKKLIECFGLHFGITHGEFLYDEEKDELFLVEIAARGGGVFISSELIPAASGVNAVDLLVKEALDISENKLINISKGASAYFCYLTPEGKVKSIDGIEEVEKAAGVRKAFFDNIAIGMETKSIRDKSSRKGPILVQGKTKEDCYNAIENVKTLLNISVQTTAGEMKIIWS